MRVIRHESGWDVALDMVFTDKQTAATIAVRIQNAVHALIREAVDPSMSKRNAGEYRLDVTRVLVNDRDERQAARGTTLQQSSDTGLR